MLYNLTVADKVISGILVESQQEMVELIQRLRFARHVVVDLETEGLRWYHGDKIIGIAIALPEYDNAAYYVSFRHKEGFNWSISYMKPFRRLLTNPDVTYYGWNYKFDMHFLQAEGFPILERKPQTEDVMIALHLLDENRYERQQNYKLKDVARQFIDKNAADESEILTKKLAERGMKKGSMSILPASDVAEYAMMDVVLTWELRQLFYPYLQKWQVVELYHTQNRFLREVLLRMEHNGMYVDRELTQQKIIETQAASQAKLQALQQAIGADFNPNSPQQVSAALSTLNAQKATLDALAKKGNVTAKSILEYKQLSKAVSTFFEPYLYWSSGDGKIHPTLNVIGTVTGRLSCSDPNLQQIPRQAKDDTGYDVKTVFTAPEGYIIAQFDYKALELRLATHFAEEPSMLSVFNVDGDPHQMTADKMGINRHMGKTLNFGLLYGMGIPKAAVFLNIPQKTKWDGERIEVLGSDTVVPQWNGLYPAFRQTHNALVETAQSYRKPDGTPALPQEGGYQYIRLSDGRVRHYSIDDPPYYSAWNTLIQGTGALVMRDALLQITNRYGVDQTDVIPVLTVHDSFVCYIKIDSAATVIPDIIQLMTDFDGYNPKLAVEAEIGYSYGKLVPYEMKPFDFILRVMRIMQNTHAKT